MTDADLLTLIRGNASLKALADAGNDAGLAALVPSLATVSTPKPFAAADLMGVVSQGNIAKVVGSPGVYLSLQQAILSQDRAAAGAEAQLCVIAGLITSAEQTQINAVLGATVSVPDTSVDHNQVSRVLATIRPKDAEGVVRATPIAW
jgi:hypothetical protein